jgi:hypothetical protein
MSYFQDATVTHEGSTFELSAAEGRRLESGAYSWQGPGDPSSSLAVDVLQVARLKAAGAPEVVALELASQALGITVERLHEIVRWHEEYMRWHDGQPD